MPGPVDGIMGQQTRNAIAAFQRDNGMEATGEVDQEAREGAAERGDDGRRTGQRQPCCRNQSIFRPCGPALFDFAQLWAQVES
jgi:peptidoglycan hydrolase-like protein with peptidoglycan-binding domain